MAQPGPSCRGGSGARRNPALAGTAVTVTDPRHAGAASAKPSSRAHQLQLADRREDSDRPVAHVPPPASEEPESEHFRGLFLTGDSI